MKVGIFVTTASETSLLGKQLTNKAITNINGNNFATGNLGETEVVISSHSSSDDKTKLANDMLIFFKVDVVIYSGISGAVTPTFKNGDIVVGASLEAKPGTFTPLDKWLSSSAHEAALGVKDRLDATFVETNLRKFSIFTLPSVKQASIGQNPAGASKDTIAIDSTGCLIAQVCMAAEKPLATTCVISELAEKGDADGMRAFVQEIVNQYETAFVNSLLPKCLDHFKQQKILTTESRIQQLAKDLELSPHPEGGFYKETYRSDETAKFDKRYAGDERSISTGIYFLIKTAGFSAWHRIKSDEMWHFYEGSPVTILTIDPASNALKSLKLGRTSEHPGTEYTVVVPKEHWFCAYVEEDNSFALCGCTVAPGFAFQDFELADRTALQAEFPEHEEVIARFTR